MTPYAGDAVVAFLAQLGIAIPFPPERGLTLHIEQIGHLHIEEGEGELLVTARQALPVRHRDRCGRVLSLLHYEVGPELPVQAALHDDELLFTVRTPSASVDRFWIARAVDTLAALQDRAGALLEAEG